jgi:osmotically-inducible protein OsmY
MLPPQPAASALVFELRPATTPDPAKDVRGCARKPRDLNLEPTQRHEACPAASPLLVRIVMSEGPSRNVIDMVQAALRGEVRLDHRVGKIHIEFREGVLELEGELPDVKSKKLVLERAAAIDEVEWVTDHLTVEPATEMRDGEICAALRKHLLGEPTLRECVLHDKAQRARGIIRQPPNAVGEIIFEVDDGIITLNGEVPSLSHRRLAGVLAWWVPGARDVRNWLGVEPVEEDNDDEISDAVKLVLEKDPFVDGSQVGVLTREANVTLSGAVSSDAERGMAERDTWFVQGVDDVCNELVVGTAPSE